MLKKLYHYRFFVVFLSFTLALFGPLLFPYAQYTKLIWPIVYSFNIFVSFLLCSKNKKKLYTLFTLFITSILVYSFPFNEEAHGISFIRYGLAFVFYMIVCLELIKQIWSEREVDNLTLFGLAAGYISLGFGGYFIYLGVDLQFPNSFSGLLTDPDGLVLREDSLLYFSFVTLLTIGFGDIKPLTTFAQKATILVGLTGQFYLIFVTAIVLDRFKILPRKEKDNSSSG